MTESLDIIRPHNVSPEREGRLKSVLDADEPVDFASLAATSSVAALNLSPRPGEVNRNLLLAEKAIVRVKNAHPLLKWVVLPELFTSGYTELNLVRSYAEGAEQGMSVCFFSDLARKLDLCIAYGFPERLPVATGEYAQTSSLQAAEENSARMASELAAAKGETERSQSRCQALQAEIKGVHDLQGHYSIIQLSCMDLTGTKA